MVFVPVVALDLSFLGYPVELTLFLGYSGSVMYLLVAVEHHFLVFAFQNVLYEELLFAFLPQDHLCVVELLLALCLIAGYVRMPLVFLILFRVHVPRHFFFVLQFRYFVVRLLLSGGQRLFFLCLL